ncbi:MAG: universal stress protein [Rhodospirillales bacterium]|nr:universal stress protein [Rhodospirillales bacterium]MBT3907176.1 universal stress protein [Rhodospirillaceae bacterium]MBT5036408.1 universal stress protein [Rhodospirillaceae bacterium]MBT6364540.1 universal stress protein [Rhodospirillaceae bacterium]MBT7771651.1 universal stress protein [Rhodospirillales bacterium]
MYKNILIATDGSELATRGLSHGLELAKTLNIPVTVVTTTETWSVSDIARETEHRNPNPIAQYEDIVAEASKLILASAKEAAEQLGVSCECVHVADRHPAEGILETATSKGCNLIVMASHGRRGVKKALLGSVANEVLSNSAVPVLIIR